VSVGPFPFPLAGSQSSFPVQGASAFGPRDLPALARWYDFSDAATLFQDDAFASPVTAADQTIGGVRDKSGLGRDVTQATASRRPVWRAADLNGRPCCEADGVDDFLRSVGSATVPQPFTTILIARHTSAVANQVWFDSVGPSGATPICQQLVNSSTRRALHAGASIASANPPDTVPHLFVATFDGPNSSLRVDGSLDLTGDPGSNALIGITLFSNRVGSGGNWTAGLIGEFLLYARALEPWERAALRQYARAKWGIA
jgi:hypothetical protein